MTATLTPPRPSGDAALRSALAARAQPPRASALSAALTFFWRAVLKIKHVPEQLIDVTIFPVMFTLMFTYLFGGALAGSTDQYLQFLLPGILVQTVVMITMYTGLGLNLDIDKGVFDRIRTLPIWRPAAIVGMLLGDAARYSMASAMVIVLGLVLGFRPAGGFGGVLLAVLVVLAFSFCVSWIWTALGLTVRTQNSLMMISMLILFPLTFASNIFVDPRTMPDWLRLFVEANPISHLTTVVRELMAGNLPTGELLWVAVVCLVLLAIFGPLTMRQYNRER
ncbi:MAG: ABC transporter permease [Dehalococcoidia bacterium]